MDQISVIIITLNEERNILATLEAAGKVADEIVVMDSGSTDRTAVICIEKKVRFIQQEWLGYSPQRNKAVGLATHDYILVLDADEVLDPVLIDSILALKAKGFQHAVYSLRRKNYYYGKFILHGMESNDVKARLYHRSHATWNDKRVHEDLEYDRSTKAFMLPGWLLHYTYRHLSEHVLKTDRYTSLSALEYYERGKPAPGFIKLVLSPVFTFIQAYIFKAGFLDGWHGWILAKMHAHSVLQKYSKLKLMHYLKKNEVKGSD